MTVVNINFQKIKGPVDPLAVPLNFGSDTPPPPPPATGRFVWSKPAPTLRVTAAYSTNVSRPTVANTGVRWQPGISKPIDLSSLWDGGKDSPVEHRLLWQQATHLPADTAIVSEQLTPKNVQSDIPWEQGVPQDAAVTSKNKQLTPSPVPFDIPWQQGRASPRFWADSFVVLNETPRELHIPWQQGAIALALKHFVFGKGRTLRTTHYIPWQQAKHPRGGMEPPFVPVNPNAYIPQRNLNFKCRCVFPDPLNIVLNFGVNPCPEQVTTVPTQKVYFIVNNLSLKRVSDNVQVGVSSVTVGIDKSSWCWSFAATIPYTELEKVEPSVSGPVEVELDINGLLWRFLVEDYSNRKEFAKSAVSIRGRSVTAYLESPRAPTRSYAQTSTIFSRALAEAELERPGLVTGFTLDWQLIDSLGWLMPADTWSYSDLTPMQVIQSIAQGAGGFVNSHPSAKEIIVLPEYPVPYWEWAAATPAKIIPKSVIKSQNLQWQEKPSYNGVYVIGENTGVNAFVKRAGTDGSLQAPMFVSPMISAQEAARNKGMSILSAGGKQAQIGLELPMVPSLGLVTPGMLIEVTAVGIGAEPSWRGLVRSTSISATWNDALTVSQSIELERHYGGL